MKSLGRTSLDISPLGDLRQLPLVIVSAGLGGMRVEHPKTGRQHVRPSIVRMLMISA
jgi:hypothetical protein